MQNLIYALIQVVHNFGAATVIGTAATALWLARGNMALQRRLAALAAVGWAVQAASGASFGIATYSFEKHLPDIHGIAVAALGIKVVCAVLGFLIALIYAMRSPLWQQGTHLAAWRTLFALAVTALSSAAFLRWFS